VEEILEMKLYYLSIRSGANVYTGYDSMEDIVVRARSKRAARKLAASISGGEGADVWEDDRKTNCEKLSNDGAPGIICRSFLAG